MKEKMEINKESEGVFFVKSHLKNIDGENTSIRLRKLEDGKVPLTAFFDIDLTLLKLEELLYPQLRRMLWPNIDPSKVDKIHSGGFLLGTMFKEMYRMKMFNDFPADEKIQRWVDADVYDDEFLAGDGKNINNLGDKYHEIAAAELKRFDEVATQVAKDIYQKNPESYDKAKIGPIFQLAEEYKRLGGPMVGMTANPRNFIIEVLKYTGLADKFIECATDDDVLGDKEYKIKWLVDILEADGIPVSYDRLETIGDSVTGDIGSGPRFEDLIKKSNPDIKIKTHGLLIIESEEDLSKARVKLTKYPELQSRLKSPDKVQVLRWDKVKRSLDGTFAMTSKNRSDFLEPIA